MFYYCVYSWTSSKLVFKEIDTPFRQYVQRTYVTQIMHVKCTSLHIDRQMSQQGGPYICTLKLLFLPIFTTKMQHRYLVVPQASTRLT